MEPDPKYESVFNEPDREWEIRGLFEKFVDWWQCAAVKLLCLPLHNNGAMPPVHELSEWPS
jgi:hypothetical protein